jgi:hypothetical protein
MPKLQTRLVFYSDDMSPVEIYGYVEDTNVNQFSQDLEIQVSIICPDPYFTAVSPTIITGQSDRDNTTPATIVYNGSVATGINVELTRLSDPAPTSIGIQVGDSALSYFNVAAGVDSSKYFLMNSLSGNKYVQNVAFGGGTITNLLPKVQTGSQWPILQPGSNEFSIITDQGGQDYQLTYYEKYGGL